MINKKNRPRKYTVEQYDFLREFIPGHKEAEIITAFKERFDITLTVSMVGNLKVNLGVKSGTIGGRFKKGIVPGTKGKKWFEFCTPEAHARSMQTAFKKGQIPLNHKPVGSETLRQRRGRRAEEKYLHIKIGEPNKWQLKHQFVWEQTNGKIPKGYAVIFLDKNPLNCTLENLQLVSRAELARINQKKLFVEDAELNKTACIIAKIITAAGKAKRKEK